MMRSLARGLVRARALAYACVLLGACGGSDADEGPARPSTSTGARMDAGSVEERPPRDAEADDDAGSEALPLWRDASAELGDAGPGVHLLLGDEPPQKAAEVFLLQVGDLALRGDFANGSQLTIHFRAALGDYGCNDGAQLQYQDARGIWVADALLGDCHVQVSRFEATRGAPVAGSFEGELERIGGEAAQALRVAGRFEIGYP